MSGMTKELIHRFIVSQRLAVFTTIAAGESKPQSALVGIAVTTSCEVVFDTLRSSRKYKNLTQNPAASLVIGCTADVTVQFEGEARELAGAELTALQAIYFAKWPDGPERLYWPGITYIAVRPHWIRYSDFNTAPPVIEELMFPFV